MPRKSSKNTSSESFFTSQFVKELGSCHDCNRGCVSVLGYYNKYDNTPKCWCTSGFGEREESPSPSAQNNNDTGKYFLEVAELFEFVNHFTNISFYYCSDNSTITDSIPIGGRKEIKLFELRTLGLSVHRGGWKEIKPPPWDSSRGSGRTALVNGGVA